MAAAVNKVAYDFMNGEVSIDLVTAQGTSTKNLRPLPILEGVEEVNYTTTIEREKMYGSSRLPVARTDGSADFEASITMLAYWWRYLVDVANELGIGLANIELNVTYSLFKDANIPIHTDTLYRCKIKSPEMAFKRGPENLMVPVSLDPMNIFYDGFDIFGNKLA